MQITAADIQGRAKVSRLAGSDPKAALRLARTIAHPWYRCQSLAAAAGHLRGRERRDALLAAWSAASEQDEPNRIVTVATWPLRVLVESDPALAAQWADDLVAIAATEPHNLRRSHALQALAFAASPHPALLAAVVPALADALLGGRGPRIDRVIRDTWALVASTRPDLLRPLALHHKANQRQQRLLATLA